MKKIYFWQPQSPTKWEGKTAYWLPYTVACLWSYAQQSEIVRENYELGEFFFKRQAIDEVLEELSEIDVAVFSCYIWNFEYNKKMAAAVKARWPHCKVIFGGPQITNRPLETNFFRDHRYVDHVVNGEGEIAFAELLEKLACDQFSRKNINFTRLTDLGYESPYAGGLFDHIVARHPEYLWQAVIETNRGCPYACTFCDWGSLTYSKIIKVPEERVLRDIDWCSENRVAYLFIADANFGILHERDKKFAQHINQKQRLCGWPKVALAQWAKNGKEKILEVAQIFFNDYNRGFTLSVQSMEDTVLEAIKRKNMEVSDMHAMLELCAQKNIPAYTELILGLPHETTETWRRNHVRLFEIGQHHYVDVWWAQLLENAELNSPQQRAEHMIKSLKLPRIVVGSIPDEVIEYEHLIVENRYMTTEELINCYVFSSIIIGFHYLTGITNILSRFLVKIGSRSYDEFYAHLESEILQGNHWISQPFIDLNYKMHRYLKNQDMTDPSTYNQFHSGTWLVTKPLILDITKTLENVFDIFTQDWCRVDAALYQSLKDFAFAHVVDYHNVTDYPQKKKFTHDVYSYATNQSDTYDREVAYEFSYGYQKMDAALFLELAYHERRSREVLNTQVKVVKN
jgi:putative methyltransferase